VKMGEPDRINVHDPELNQLKPEFRWGIH